jgi:hypothetical protein
MQIKQNMFRQPSMRPKPKAHAYLKLQLSSVRCSVGQLPTGRRKELSQNCFSNKNQMIIWKRPVFIMHYTGRLTISEASLCQGKMVVGTGIETEDACPRWHIHAHVETRHHSHSVP